MKAGAIEIPILTYHSIDTSGSVISTHPDTFREQMEILGRSARVLSLKDVASCLREKKSPPDNSVAITFDDGFRNLIEAAFPVLKEFGFRATIFLVTGYCGKDNRWYGQPAKIPTLELLSWEEIARMSEAVDFGIHTANHPDLTRLPAEKLQGEILGARECLQERTGAREQSFAYPYGKTTSIASELVKKHFFAACSTEMNFASEASDLYFLPRIDMYYFSNNSSFVDFGTPAFRRYIRFRSLLRRVREVVAK